MEFKFSKKEELLQWAVNDFAQRELATKKIETLNSVPKEIIQKMGELGFLGFGLPEKYGGKPATWVMYGILAEEIAKANVAIAHLLMVSYGMSLPFSKYGTPEAMGDWLSGLVRGEKVGCISLTEPACGTDVGAIQTRAVRDGDDYVISGEKGPVSFGTQANVTILFAKTDTEGGAKGTSAFLVPLDLPGITKTSIKNMGMLPSGPALFTFQEVRIPALYRIGQEGEGFDINETTGLFSNLSWILSGLISLGLSQAALSQAISYGKQRMAFGRPIAQFEGISGKIAEDATLIEASRWLCYRALWLKDQNSPNTKEAAMCGWWCPKVAFQVIEDALLIHGHSGYCDDLPFQQMLRDVTAFELIAGTEQFLKLIIAQRVIGKVAIPNEMIGFPSL